MPGDGARGGCMNITETHSCSEALPRRSHADSAAAPARSSKNWRPFGRGESIDDQRFARGVCASRAARECPSPIRAVAENATSGLAQPWRRSRRRLSACRSPALHGSVRNCREYRLRHAHGLRLQEIRFRQHLHHDQWHFLALLLVTFRHGNAEFARMLAIKCRPHGFLHAGRLRTRHEHSRPRHRLQHGPMRAAHMESADNG